MFLGLYYRGYSDAVLSFYLTVTTGPCNAPVKPTPPPCPTTYEVQPYDILTVPRVQSNGILSFKVNALFPSTWFTLEVGWTGGPDGLTNNMQICVTQQECAAQYSACPSDGQWITQQFTDAIEINLPQPLAGGYGQFMMLYNITEPTTGPLGNYSIRVVPNPSNPSLPSPSPAPDQGCVGLMPGVIEVHENTYNSKRLDMIADTWNVIQVFIPESNPVFSWNITWLNGIPAQYPTKVSNNVRMSVCFSTDCPDVSTTCLRNSSRVSFPIFSGSSNSATMQLSAGTHYLGIFVDPDLFGTVVVQMALNTVPMPISNSPTPVPWTPPPAPSPTTVGPTPTPGVPSGTSNPSSSHTPVPKDKKKLRIAIFVPLVALAFVVGAVVVLLALRKKQVATQPQLGGESAYSALAE